jgi:hypothetical protein
MGSSEPPLGRIGWIISRPVTAVSPSGQIVNLVDRQVEVYTKPGPRGYRSTEVFKEWQSLPVVIGGREVGLIVVADILPPRRRRMRAKRNNA